LVAEDFGRRSPEEKINLEGITMTTELHIQLSEDYEKLSNLSQMQKLSDKEIFAQIAEMDRKYGDYPPHYFSFDGLISNLGHDQKSVTVLNYAIKRLKDLSSTNLRLSSRV
jgi:hypothetical protein